MGEIKVKLLIDTDRNKVVFVESDCDFVDVLLSALLLPLGKIIKSLKAELTVGSIDNLYKSVKDLDEKHLQTSDCRSMLIDPRSAYHSERYYNLLSNDIDLIGSWRTRYYRCGDDVNTRRISTDLPTRCKYEMVSSVYGSKCPCGNQFREKIDLLEALYGVKGIYHITDDLRVVPVSNSLTIFSWLKKIGVEESLTLEEKTLVLRPTQALLLVKRALLSNTPLTDVLLGKQEMDNSLQSQLPKHHDMRSEQTNSSKTIHLKLVVSKSSNKVLYAESGADFIDFLFSFLTFPLGAIMKLVGGTSSIGCMHNLYNSVQGISFEEENISEECTRMFLGPKLPQHFKCTSQLLNIDEQGPLRFINCKCNRKTSSIILSDISIHDMCGATPLSLNFINPKLKTLEAKGGGGFVNDKIVYIVSDALDIKPLSYSHAKYILNDMNVPVSDIDECAVIVTEREGLKLLRASLTSKTVLNDVFADFLNKIIIS